MADKLLEVSVDPGEARALESFLVGLPRRIARNVARTVSQTMQDALLWMIGHRLSGPRPRVLGIRTGALIRSAKVSSTGGDALYRGGEFLARAYIDPNAPSGRRGGAKPIVYGAVWEYGFDGHVAVPAHTRTVTTVFGRPTGPITQHVRAHSRHLKADARPFLQPTADVWFPIVGDRALTTIADAIDGEA